MANLLSDTNRTSGKAEIKITLSETECGRDFTFTLHGNHIGVDPVYVKLNGNGAKPWHELLTDAEKLKIFNAILADYRHRSLGDEGFKLAALGITEQGKIYISENTEQLSSDFYRQCAEQNMVTISTQRDVYDQIRERIRAGEDPKDIVPQNPKYRAVYLMGGRLPEIPVACPCGNCTDLLSKVMLPDSNVWILPVNEGDKTLEIRDDIEMARELKPNQAWKTTIQHLNRERLLPLIEENSEQANQARSSMKRSLSSIRDWVGRYAEEDPNRALGRTEEHNINPNTHAGKIRLKALTNDAMVDLGKLKTFMHEQIMVTLADRIEAISQKMGLGSISDLSDEQISAIAQSVDVQSVRCAVVQRDDGRLYAATEAKSAVDKAAPDPEISALAAAKAKLGTQGIRQCWSMEFDTAHIAAGVVETPSKAAVERLIKKPSVITGKVDFGFFAFDDVPVVHDVAAKQMLRRDGEQLSPGYYTGKRPLGLAVLQRPPASHDCP